ncbi:MAG: hypothetical protein JNL84_01850 [Candidatus Accumulibacter sp.]|nr:hypothetical protein [Accumulibacter sp.]
MQLSSSFAGPSGKVSLFALQEVEFIELMLGDPSIVSRSRDAPVAAMIFNPLESAFSFKNLVVEARKRSPLFGPR